MSKVPDFMEGATNVYRTRDYIVKQVVGIQYNVELNNVVFSHDTFYARTVKRDREYNYFFRNRKNKNGKRLPTTMYARAYVD